MRVRLTLLALRGRDEGGSIGEGGRWSERGQWSSRTFGNGELLVSLFSTNAIIDFEAIYLLTRRYGGRY